MSTFKIDLDYNAEHVKGKILKLKAIYRELLMKEKRILKKELNISKELYEGKEESKEIELKAIYQELLIQEKRILRRECAVLQDLLELHEGKEESKEIEPVVEPKKKSDKIICECGMEIVKRNLKRHCTSKNHIFFMEIKPKKKSDKIICECGMEIVKRNLKRHCTSKNHIFNMEIKQIKETTDLQI